MWDKILDNLYYIFIIENKLRVEKGLKVLTFKQYLKEAGKI